VDWELQEYCIPEAEIKRHEQEQGPETDFPQIREFLVRFEEARRRNRELVATQPNSKRIDRRLVEYDQLNRSTNDQRSHQGRFQILCEYFETTIKGRSR